MWKKGEVPLREMEERSARREWSYQTDGARGLEVERGGKMQKLYEGVEKEVNGL